MRMMGGENMGFADAVRTCLGKYAAFSGRASRPEYWWFYLFVLLAISVAALPFLLLNLDGVAGFFAGLAGLLLFLPALAAAIRRLHDTDKSGWWALISFVPYVGSLILVILMILPGTDGDNRYGPKPVA